MSDDKGYTNTNDQPDQSLNCQSIHVLNILLLRSYSFWMKIEMGVVKI